MINSSLKLAKVLEIVFKHEGRNQGYRATDLGPSNTPRVN